MSKDIKNKKLILGSALAGLMVAAPGISLTAQTQGKFFQTAQLEVGYRLAQAGEAEDDTGDKGTVEQDEEKKTEEQSDTPTTQGEPKAEKKGDSSKSCGAGSCGGGN